MRNYGDKGMERQGVGRLKGRKRIAWSGMSFTVPVEWAPVIIEKTYILFESNRLPAMEIKWFRDPKLPLNAPLELLTAGFSTISNPPARMKIPGEWEPYLGSFESRAFSWRDGATRAIGLGLHCKHCRTTTLIQFFSYVTASPHEAGRQVIASFQDHTFDNRWSIFDFEALLPKLFELKSFSFRAGRFELHYAVADTKVSLYRLAVAQELLRGQTLENIVSELFSVNTSSLVLTDNYSDVRQWYSRKHGFYSKLAARLTRAPLVEWGRLRHDKTNDKLLAVHASGKTLDLQELTNISDKFCIT